MASVPERALAVWVIPVLVAKEGVAVESVVEKFRDKYGAGDVKKYYSKVDVAVVTDIR